MDLITIMTNGKRPDLLIQSADHLHDSGGYLAAGRIICVDGPTLSDRQPWERLTPEWRWKHKSDGPSGTRFMMWWIYRLALEGGADRLLFCEDDLVCAPYAVRDILAMEIPKDIAFITFFDHKEVPGAAVAKREGFTRCTGRGRLWRGMWGTQCVLIPRRTLEWVTQKGAGDWGDPWPHTKSGGDCVFSWAVEKSPTPDWLVYSPSLVEHVGDVSTVQTHTRIRRAAWFKGR